MRVNVAEAKAKLSELIERAMAGEEIEVTKRGRPAVRIVASNPPKKKLDVDSIRAWHKEMERLGAKMGNGAERLIREMRDSRY